MKIEHTPLPGVVLLTPRVFEDARGLFMETWNHKVMAEAGLDIHFVQDNSSLSRAVGTLRGLHFQTPPRAQAKLVRVLRGRIWDVAVDLRSDSATFGQHFGAELSADNRRQMLVPEGFAHGFVTLEPDTEVAYKVGAYYDPACDAGLAWDDPDLAIPWPLEGRPPVLSDKDQRQPRLADWTSCF